ncbi:hypothetical protein EON65_51560, partial [archaeon]
MLLLAHLLDDWLDFRYAEVFELLRMHGYRPEEAILCNRHWRDDDAASHHYDITAYAHLSEAECVAYWEAKRGLVPGTIDHFMLLSLPNEHVAKQIFSRAVLVKGLYELYTMAETFEENVSFTSSFSVPSLQSQIESCEDTWCIQVVSFSRTLSMQVKSTLRNRFSFLPFRGAVSLSEPQRIFSIFLDFSRHVDHRVKIPEDDERLLNPPVPTYFTRALLLSPLKSVLQKFSLKQRIYLGPTSLDEQLAFVMCNLSAVSNGTTVWEPFVGTGGLAVCAAYRGAFVLGSDIDIRVLKGLRHAGPTENLNGSPNVIPNGNVKQVG